jgi:hypothetical protein
MTRYPACWLLLATSSLAGCSSIEKLFGKDDDTPDAAATISDATPPPTSDAGPPGPGRDTAPELSIPVVPPPDLAVEAPAIKTAVAAFSAALTTRDLTAAAAQLVPAARAGYRTMFEGASPDQLDRLAAALAQVEVTTLVPSTLDQAVLRAEAVVALDGRTFHVRLLKVDNQWFLESL